MQALADFIAQHAVAVLVGVALLLLVATALFWRLVERYAPLCWRIVLLAWNWLASTSVAARLRQLSLLGPAMSRALRAVRYLGVLATLAFAVAVFAIVVLLMALRRWTLAAAWSVATLTGGLLNACLKVSSSARVPCTITGS